MDSWPNYEPRIVLRKDPTGVHIIKGVKLLVALETNQSSRVVLMATHHYLRR